MRSPSPPASAATAAKAEAEATTSYPVAVHVKTDAALEVARTAFAKVRRE